MTPWLTHKLLFAAGCLASAQALAAGNILIWPIDPWLAPDAKAAELWIQNQSSEATTMQVRVVGWQQQDGHEKYQPQQDVVASPPIVQIAGGGKQLIRLIKQNVVPPNQEQAYRIVVDEIPQPRDNTKPQMGLKLQMRYSIPLFAYGAGMVTEEAAGNHANTEPAKLSWRVVDESGKPTLQVTNRGNVHARLSKVTLRQGSQQRVLADGLMGYVLPGSQREWPLPASLSRPDQLSATINARSEQWQTSPVN
ncbi:putative fimbrial protein TcfA [Buttiauxella agrestis]|uniref:Putative fimbrial protein TcfA n=1 Tax=Buttiauxella agrestis TaxID=82977 RepID=A0A381C6A1_9ENTR|nr:molecular chaperone [Buttiauxella agrestis]SUW63370.1 putative fimbrial protein TcfA [Buttiauxella agrestis]